MLSTLRRVPGAVGSALRSSSSLTHQALRLRPLSGINAIYPRSRTASRSMHVSSTRLEAASAALRARQSAFHGSDESPSQKHEPVTRFQELADRGLVKPEIIRAVTEDMRLTTMTPVQSMTIAETLKGDDVLAQAKTGTGKTLAFLIPLLQTVLQNNPELADGRRGRRRAAPEDIKALVISPTRELAEQIAAEAKKVTARTGLKVQTAVGGTQKRAALQEMQRYGCHILVGTPGRLKDILSDPSSGVEAPGLKTLVLDEADRLLDQGFWPEIQEIQRLLPDPRSVDRQTMLFSATIPREVMALVRDTLKPDYHFLRTVQEGEQPTHERIPQKIVTLAGLENMMPALLELVNVSMERASQPAESGEARDPFKAIVYFNSTANVSLAAETFRLIQDAASGRSSTHPLRTTRIIEIHSRLSQQQRTAAADSFRRAKSGILFSSDVTARGMDFPNVTHVIQMGTPSSRDSYIHRVGRTGRGHKGGEGWLFIIPFETREVRQKLSDLPLQADQSLQTASVDMSRPAELPATVAEMLLQVGQAAQQIPRAEKVKAYKAHLGTYGYLPPKQLVKAVNGLAKYGWGLDSPIAVSPILAQRLGIDRVPEVQLGYEDEDEEPRRGGGGRGGRSFSDDGGRGRGYGGDRGAGGGGGGRNRYGSGSGGFSTYNNRDRGGRATGGGGYGRDRDMGRSGGGGGGGGYGRDRRRTFGSGDDDNRDGGLGFGGGSGGGRGRSWDR